ncbi:hypothetical protein METBIDRAFT_16615, partial [Metschnikowia bicuspidata var. bicuspidata NRRL YB-4993]
MSHARPKRKAAANKNYTDPSGEALFETPAASAGSAPSNPPAGPAAPKTARKRPAPGSRPPSGLATPPGRKNAAPGAPPRHVPYNWQPPVAAADEFSHKLDLAGATVNTSLQTLSCPAHAAPAAHPVGGRRKQPRACLQIHKGDYIYMVSEPPGEPYYIGRVKGFKRKDELAPQTEVESAALYVFQIQWFYRPRDILKHTLDSRLLFASMHSDACPLSSFRGLLTVLHKLDVEALFVPPAGGAWGGAVEFYLSLPNCFYFDKLYDRYILKFYDVVRTAALLPHLGNAANCSRNYILALNKRFEFVCMESTRTKGFLNTFSCTRSTHCDVCAEWCGLADAVACASCARHFHMLCLDPPLLKKPSRGFSWSCARCSKKHELEHQSKKILMLAHDNRSSNADELSSAPDPRLAHDDPEPSSPTKPHVTLPKYELMATDYLLKDSLVSVLERRLKEEWNIRYLGLHARLEEAVDPYDRSYYPRASTSLGQRYQVSNIPECTAHPIVYYDPDKSPAEKNKKKPSSSRRPAKKKPEAASVKALPIPKEFQGVSPKDFPLWLQPRPKGYIERGVDDGAGETCTLMWKASQTDFADNFKSLDAFVATQDPVAARLGIHPNSPNFADAVAHAYMCCNGNTQKASEIVSRLTRASLKEPTLNKEEVKRFEAGVKKHGSELYPVSKEVRTQPTSMVVRFYYIWKKTKRGHLIWGNFPGRKKKPTKEPEMRVAPIVDDYADSDDDSAYENEKIIVKKKPFQCKHCKSYTSQKWFKITGFDGTTVHTDASEVDDIDPSCVTALCFRCAKIWRRYAVYWEDPLEVEKKIAKGVGGYRKKVESELVADAEKILLHARNEGLALSYEVTRKQHECSVMHTTSQSKSINGLLKPPAQITLTPKAVAEEIKPATKPKQKPSNGTKSTPRQRKTTSTETAPDVHNLESTEAAGKISPEEGPNKSAIKKRKVEPKLSSETAKPERPKKRQAPVKTEPSTKAKKNKVSPSISLAHETSVKNEPEETVKAEKLSDSKTDPKAAPVRRQRKNTDTTSLVSPLFNPNYQLKLEDSLSASRNDKKSLPPLDKDTLTQVLDNFKYRQLLDMKLIIQGWQAPQQAKIDVPFAPNDRNCSICLEHDNLDSSSQEMLICSNCGVNVHGSCAGIIVSGKVKPVRQWLCDPCVNDMGPQFSTNYSCSICLAKSTNAELAILGEPLERPDYLLPIIETGRWCHMICALYCHDQIAFRHVLAPTFVAKEILGSTSTKSIGCLIESVSKVFVENFDKRCGICNCFNGGLIKCDMCETEDNAFHVTCAQDTPNFKLGFKLVPQKINRSSTNTFVRDQVGKLQPILICPKHEQKGNILEIRDQGKRSPSGESKPLIQLFIEDLMRQGHRLSGTQLRAHNYISMITTVMEK